MDVEAENRGDIFSPITKHCQHHGSLPYASYVTISGLMSNGRYGLRNNVQGQPDVEGVSSTY
jgi:hypothetical protein